MARSSLFLLLVFFVLCDSVPADSVDTRHLQGLGQVRYHFFDSETLGHPLHLYVRLPESARDSKAGPFPTVYLLDGGTTFPLLSAYYHYLLLAEELPDLVLVGISYGSDTFEGGNFRSSDFTAASTEREWWGNAPVFQRVLEQELIPLVENTYPSASGRRIIFGQSLGGQFVLYTALTRPELFQGHIASNPALHRNLDFFLEWRGDGPMPVTSSRLFVSMAEQDDQRFRDPALRWAEAWRAREPKPWRLQIRQLPGQSHLSAAPMAFRQGMLWLMNSP